MAKFRFHNIYLGKANDVNEAEGIQMSIEAGWFVGWVFMAYQHLYVI